MNVKFCWKLLEGLVKNIRQKKLKIWKIVDWLIRKKWPKELKDNDKDGEVNYNLELEFNDLLFQSLKIQSRNKIVSQLFTACWFLIDRVWMVVNK